VILKPSIKPLSGLIKLLFPDPEMPIPDEELEKIVRIACESRRRGEGTAKAAALRLNFEILISASPWE